MALKTILVAASGGTASDGAIEIACRLASLLEAHVEGFHVRTDPNQILMLAGDGFNMPISGEWIDRFIADTAEVARTTKDAFTASVARHKLVVTEAPRKGATATWREETGYAPFVVSRHARFFDLAVLGRSERVFDRPHTDTVEEALIHSGRPVLIAPARPPTVLGETIAVGWNGTPESVHVLAASLPILAAARKVTLITIGAEPGDSPLGVFDYLLFHGIVAEHRQVHATDGVGPGEQLLAEAHDLGADLLAMGGYGHRPWRETLFGGATRQVIGTSLLPVLLAH